MASQGRFDCVPLGDDALLVRLGDELSEELNERARSLADAVEAAKAADPACEGIIEASPAYSSALIDFDPLLTTHAEVEAFVRSARPSISGGEARRIVRVPVAYGGDAGPDLASIAAEAGLSADAVAAVHRGRDYPVYMLGFAPGFPYLGGVDERIASGRLATPRARIPAGSVGIAGRQTGVYPFDSPGGWKLIGRTPMRLFDARKEPPAIIRPGDLVRFYPIGHDEFEAMSREPGGIADEREEASATPPSPESSAIRVVKPGLSTTVQDLGRRGYQKYGVPVSGAMDRLSARLANRLVGNAPSAACLETTLIGPTLEFLSEAEFAVAGAPTPMTLDGEPVPMYARVRAGRGSVLEMPPVERGARSYVAVAGGFAVEAVLGSRSTYARARLGGVSGRRLEAGDLLPIGRPARAPLGAGDRDRGPFRARTPGVPLYAAGETARVRVVPGPEADALGPGCLAAFASREYRVSADSDRMGYRLEGRDPLPMAGWGAREMLSSAVNFGTVQAPPSGMPIVMMADRQTCGGYPRLASVIGADLGVLAQVPPGGVVRFEIVSAAEAGAALLERERELEAALIRGQPAPVVRRFVVTVDGERFDVEVEPR
ncbi:MAG: 5-oxoprolinase subunit PxpB [Spirochaetaceae bacterium]|nr:5-oxoprolinase subunit PxpB [Spirochaetaceae bacterium]